MRSFLSRLGLHRLATRQYHGPKKADKVVVGMSGGVDSSVTARLLVEEDYDISAVFMRNWDTRDESGSDVGCAWEKDWEDVQSVCRKLDIPCKLIDLSREYWNNVFAPSLQSWESGVTPNPDIWCNKEIKFGALLERLPSTSSTDTWFATGHYARKAWLETTEGILRPQLLRGIDPRKDQSYYLSSISEAGLRRALFPLGYLHKTQVLELAKRFDLPTWARPESMGICFVGEKRKFHEFVSAYIPPKPGPIVNKATGEVIAQHTGLWNYTIGQNARIQGMPQRMFVAEKDTITNTVFVVPGTDNALLYCNSLLIPEFTWIWTDSPPQELNTLAGFRARVMHRYLTPSVSCTVHRIPDSGHIKIHFDEPEKSVAPGQVAALYKDSWCLGCGIIQQTS